MIFLWVLYLAEFGREFEDDAHAQEEVRTEYISDDRMSVSLSVGWS